MAPVPMVHPCSASVHEVVISGLPARAEPGIQRRTGGVSGFRVPLRGPGMTRLSFANQEKFSFFAQTRYPLHPCANESKNPVVIVSQRLAPLPFFRDMAAEKHQQLQQETRHGTYQQERPSGV
ncbi:protein of unknown function [Denitratisoma oestradiolicum]|uniref:Uncharacterized protein n=1 Tax=Denitratisoma oestradiolicum TaxID=311182 RepID=A0A6S6XZQ3_9PROT|nr:protein of unknown function [Denitratisoma oestradiolicum]